MNEEGFVRVRSTTKQKVEWLIANRYLWIHLLREPRLWSGVRAKAIQDGLFAENNNTRDVATSLWRLIDKYGSRLVGQ